MIGRTIAGLVMAATAVVVTTDLGLATQPDAGAGPAHGCAACHGALGEARDDIGVPRLAGLPAAYIARQLEAYAANTRENAVMRQPARDLDHPAIEALAASYAAIEPQSRPGPAPDETKLAEGERLALRGDWAEGVPPCASCHGRKGLGVGDVFPPLAGQGAKYLEAQLAAWRAGTRHDDPNGLMRSVAARLQPAQAAAVAAYYAASPATPAAEQRR